ncbi:Uncharacterised protein [Campylobacter geochelonis]|nr:Uncharacterised protein [Campylobacter geochelonis]
MVDLVDLKILNFASLLYSIFGEYLASILLLNLSLLFACVKFDIITALNFYIIIYFYNFVCNLNNFLFRYILNLFFLYINLSGCLIFHCFMTLYLYYSSLVYLSFFIFYNFIIFPKTFFQIFIINIS